VEDGCGMMEVVSIVLNVAMRKERINCELTGGDGLLERRL